MVLWFGLSPRGEHLQHLETLLAVATVGREEHRTALYNEECSGPKCQQCYNWETLIHVNKANLTSEPDILIFYFKAWPTHLSLGVQNYIRPLAFFKASRHSFVLWRVPGTDPACCQETQWGISGRRQGMMWLRVLVFTFLRFKSQVFHFLVMSLNKLLLNPSFLIYNMGIITYLQMTIQGKHMPHYLALGKYLLLCYLCHNKQMRFYNAEFSPIHSYFPFMTNALATVIWIMTNPQL